MEWYKSNNIRNSRTKWRPKWTSCTGKRISVKKCKTIGLPMIKHHNIKPDFHLNHSKPHLNKNTIFISHFRRYWNNLNWREPVGDELTVYSGKTKSFENPNNKSTNDQSVSHNINELKNICLKNVNNIIVSHIKINSIRNKFERLSHYVMLVVILTYL